MVGLDAGSLGYLTPRLAAAKRRFRNSSLVSIDWHMSFVSICSTISLNIVILFRSRKQMSDKRWAPSSSDLAVFGLSTQ